MNESSNKPRTRRLCTFMLSDFHFAIDVAHVQEVIRSQKVTPVPRSHPSILGLINLRGQLVTAVDLRHRLGLPDGPSGLKNAALKPMNIIVPMADGLISLLVDRIGDVIDVGDDLFEEPPETVTNPMRDLLQGVYKLNEYLLLVLHLEKAIQTQEEPAAKQK